MHGRGGTRQRRDARNPRDERGLADEVAVGACSGSVRRVDYEVAAAATDQVDDARTCTRFRHLADALHLEPGCLEGFRGTGGCKQLEPERCELRRDVDDRALVCVSDGEEGRARNRQRPAGGALRFGERGG